MGKKNWENFETKHGVCRVGVKLLDIYFFIYLASKIQNWPPKIQIL